MDEFTLAYIEALLFTDTDDDDNQLNDNYSVEDLAPETIEQIKADCAKFQKENADDIANGRKVTRTSYGTSDFQYAGHDFWLTRNGHGCGFWDGDWEATAGERLTEACKKFGEVWSYIGDDGKIYLSK